MWCVIFFYKLHVFSDMNVKDIEIIFITELFLSIIEGERDIVGQKSTLEAV